MTLNVPLSDIHAAETIAEELYTKYCEAVGGKAFNGDPLPFWADFRQDPKKKLQSEAWLIASAHVISIISATVDVTIKGWVKSGNEITVVVNPKHLTEPQNENFNTKDPAPDAQK